MQDVMHREISGLWGGVFVMQKISPLCGSTMPVVDAGNCWDMRTWGPYTFTAALKLKSGGWKARAMNRGTDVGLYDAFYGSATPINGRRYCAVCGCRLGCIMRIGSEDGNVRSPSRRLNGIVAKVP